LQNSVSRIQLESQSTFLELDPENGGSILNYRSETGGKTFHWMRPAGDKGLQGDILDLSCFPLFPFSSRICNGVFQFHGKEYRLPLNFLPEKHSIHGHGWRASWKLKDHSSDRATLEYHHLPDEWPWSYEALQNFSLEGENFVSSLNSGILPSLPCPRDLGCIPILSGLPAPG